MKSKLAFNKKTLFILIIFSISLGAILFKISFFNPQKDWEEYFERVGISAPSHMVTDFIKKNRYPCLDKNIALDLGAGNGDSTKYLVDFHDIAIKRIKNRKDIINQQNLKLIQSSFEELNWQQLPQLDAVIAINTLPWISKREFNKTFKAIFHQLKPGGLLILKTFGVNRPFGKSKPTMHTREEFDNLIQEYEILYFKEVTQRNDKRDHAFKAVLRKK
jgi:SAM-dependent methyltransferase